jgi:hypothetical protein
LLFTELCLSLRPIFRKVRQSKTTHLLSWLWLSSVVLFLAFRISASFEVKPDNGSSPDAQHEWILVTTHHTPAPVINPDFRLESAFPEPVFEFHFISTCSSIVRAYNRTDLALQELVRLLESSIQINAP